MTDEPKLIPDMPRHELKIAKAEGPWGGATYSYQGARIECGKGDHVCALFMEGHPIDGINFESVETVTPHVDLWLDEQRIASHYKVVPKAKAVRK